MNREEADILIGHIAANNNFRFTPEKFTRLVTNETVGYVPRVLAPFFNAKSGFRNNSNEITFADAVKGFEAKSHAMNQVRDAMLDAGAIQRKPAHYADEELSIGGEDRRQHPEFRIDRAYYGVYGFQLDAVSVQMRAVINGETKLVLQRRGAGVLEPGTLDFAAGGAVKYPEKSPLESVRAQIAHEIGPEFSHLDKIGRHTATVFLNRGISLKQPGGSELQAAERSRIPLYDVEITPEQAAAITGVKTEEAAGFELVTPAEIIRYCIEAQRIAPVMVQSFLASLIATGLMPQSDYAGEIQGALEARGGCQFKGLTP